MIHLNKKNQVKKRLTASKIISVKYLQIIYSLYSNFFLIVVD